MELKVKLQRSWTMSIAARIAPVATTGWFGLVEAGLRALLLVAAPISATIFVAQWF
jgi:hypothetical protein